MTLDGRNALVTGGAHRLGREIALALARAGAHVAISYRESGDAAPATRVAIESLGRRCVAVRCDVRADDEVVRMLETVTAELGPLDVFVASAGVFRRTPLVGLTAADWQWHLDTNLTGTFHCVHRVGLHMQSRGGAIILVADVAGLRPWRNYVPYSVSKAGVVALTQAMAIQLAPSVRVNAVAPGPILLPEDYDEKATARAVARTLLQRAGDPADVAAAVVYLATADYVTGAVLPVDGGRHLG